jgi:hypothetical protein
VLPWKHQVPCEVPQINLRRVGLCIDHVQFNAALLNLSNSYPHSHTKHGYFTFIGPPLLPQPPEVLAIAILLFYISSFLINTTLSQNIYVNYNILFVLLTIYFVFTK